ncbi:MAG: phospholipase [Halobacteriovorax sp.]|nr:phospholipase [Halobacteriovorax sp.]
MKQLLLLLSLYLTNAFAAELNYPVVASSAAEERLEKEELLKFSSFTLLAHKQNYLLPVTYNFRPNNAPNEALKARGIDTGIDRIMRVESKFQFSFKFPLATKIFAENDGLWAAYTQQSYWQVYNQNSSRPFRESNYEPELFYLKRVGARWLGFNFDAFVFGLVHQSNGQTEMLSRSWNRLYVAGIFSREHFVLGLKTWYRVPDGANDDNPDLEDYVGKFEMRFAYKNAGWTYSLLLRNSLEKDFKGYREFGISFPLDRTIKGYFQYINGYGESLLDYNVSSHRLGLGIIVSEFI